jgi:hypothetical protein
MKNKFPTKSGWFWVKIQKNYIVPCYFDYNINYIDSLYFLPGGLGDGSSNGLYEDDFEEFYEEEIIQPKF